MSVSAYLGRLRRIRGRRLRAETGIVKFVLLHDVKNDDGIRLFFIDLWEAYIKVNDICSGGVERFGLLISNVDITESILYRQHADKESSIRSQSESYGQKTFVNYKPGWIVNIICIFS